MTVRSARHLTVSAAHEARLAVQVHEGVLEHDPSLPTVVMAHGWTLTHAAWRPVLEELLTHRAVRVVTYDQRGHGDSTMGRPPKATVRLLGDDLAEVIAATVPGDSPLVLVGHSMGGMTIMAYAGAHHPEFVSRVRGVTLVGTAASVQGRTPVPLESFVMGVASRAPGIAPHFLVPTRVQGPMLFGKGADPADVRTAVAMIQRTKMPTIGKFFHAIGDHDEIESLAHFVDVPTDILVGSKDRLTPVKWARMLQESISGSTLTVLPELGHMLTYEATDDVAASLARHLT
jgi:pimeloyl-ACP methyl ester carboxylesterase